ncbi:MAG: glucosaminidase domain-containing protein [Vicingus serpentipes]|nr:glucosaminidase domain-containing protein [Vicingus serpentipes]
MKYFFNILFLLLFIVSWAQGQPAERRITRNEYIERYKDDAIREMHKSGVPASITLAQGILESADGNSPLAMYANNHFGIKCHSGWNGETMRIDDDEKNECFRKYDDVYESFRDHSSFLADRSRYAFLFDLKITDYKGWAKGLKKAGYATNPQYANLLIKLIEQHNLNQYDNYGKVPPKKLTNKKTSTVLAETKQTRIVKLHNDVKYIVVKEGDTYYRIAHDFQMNLWQIYKYNDLNKGHVLKAEEIIYLQPKKNKAAEEFHTVKEGDTMRSISQYYGVKLKKLYKKNLMIPGTQPNIGDQINLKRKKKN